MLVNENLRRVYFDLWQRTKNQGSDHLWKISELAPLLQVDPLVIGKMEQVGIARRKKKDNETGFSIEDIPRMKIALDMLLQSNEEGLRVYYDWEMVLRDFALMFASAGQNWIIHESDVNLVAAVARTLNIE